MQNQAGWIHDSKVNQKVSHTVPFTVLVVETNFPISSAKLIDVPDKPIIMSNMSTIMLDKVDGSERITLNHDFLETLTPSHL